VIESRVLTSTDSALTNCNALQVFLQEVQEEAVQAALTVYNSEAVGGGPTRQKYEKQLHITLKRQFQVNVPEKAVCFCMVFEDVSVGRSTH
jgi:hypothetical protein